MCLKLCMKKIAKKYLHFWCDWRYWYNPKLFEILLFENQLLINFKIKSIEWYWYSYKNNIPTVERNWAVYREIKIVWRRFEFIFGTFISLECSLWETFELQPESSV